MLAYASNRRRLAASRPAPHAMLAIIALHVAGVAVVMSAKMDIPGAVTRTITKTYNVPLPKETPPPPPPMDEPRPAPRSSIDLVRPIVPSPRPMPLPIDSRPAPDPSPGPVAGSGTEPAPQPQPLPIPRPTAEPVRSGPRFATPADALRPPYPPSKIAREEEASLKLRLSIDARGRVTAVAPVGPADPAFLEAARRHLMAKWRYKPATEDGRPVASTTVITLRFELEG